MFQAKELLTAFLPSTPCTQKMRDDISRVAKDEGVSRAEVQRLAFAFFLAEYVGNSNKLRRFIQHRKGAEPEQA